MQHPAAPESLAPVGAAGPPPRSDAADTSPPSAEPDVPAKIEEPARQGGSAAGEAVLEEEGSSFEETVAAPLTPAPPEPLPMAAVEVEPPAATAAAESPTVAPPVVDLAEVEVSDAEMPETAAPQDAAATPGDVVPSAPQPVIDDESPPAPDARGSNVAAAPPAEPDRTFRVWLSEIDGDRNEAAEAEWRRLLEVYPDLLGEQHSFLRRVDRGQAGVRYRVLAGPFDDRAGAGALCAAIQERNPEEHCMVVLN